MDATNIEQLQVEIAQVSQQSGSSAHLATLYARLHEQLVAAGRSEEAIICLEACAHLDKTQTQAVRDLKEPLIEQVGRGHGLLRQQRGQLERRTTYQHYPEAVQIETLALCNADCVFCPYSRMSRKGTPMPDDVLNKLLGDLEDIPRSHPFGLTFSHINEPLLDKRLPDILKRCSQTLPHARLNLISNGTTLTEQNLAHLQEVSTLQTIQVSFNDHRPEGYSEAMNLPFKHAPQNLDRLHDWLVQGKLRVKVTVRRVGRRDQVDQEFIDHCSERWPAFSVVSRPLKDFLGQVDFAARQLEPPPPEPVPVMGCSQWHTMVISANGQVARCCFDGNAEWPIGDVSKHHLLEVYSEEQNQRTRNVMTRLEAPEPCRSCNIHWSPGPYVLSYTPSDTATS